MPSAAAAATPSMLAMPLSTVTISRGACRARERDDLRRQPVAVLEAVRHEEIDVRAHRGEPAHADRARGGAVGVVVGDDHDALARVDRPRRGARRAASMFRSSRRAAAARRARGRARRRSRDAARGVERARAPGRRPRRRATRAPLAGTARRDDRRRSFEAWRRRRLRNAAGSRAPRTTPRRPRTTRRPACHVRRRVRRRRRARRDAMRPRASHASAGASHAG